MKRIYFLILTLFAVALGTSAENYALKICGNQVTSENCGNLAFGGCVKGTASYNAERKVLTLHNVCIKAPDDVTAITNQIDGLTINVEGDCIIYSAENSGIYTSKNLTVTGTGALKIKAKNGIKGGTAEHTIHFTNGVHAYIDCTQYGVVGTISHNIFQVELCTTLKVSGVRTHLQVRGKEQCFYMVKSLSLTGGVIMVRPTDACFAKYTVCDAAGTAISGEWVTMEGNLKLHGDVNGDNSVSMADANSVVNYYLAANKFFYPINRDKADVNGDNDITMADANQIVNSFLNGTETHKCVDLGLSVKWATCNVGADEPWEYGDYFSWGETSPKDRQNLGYYLLSFDNCKTYFDCTKEDSLTLDEGFDAATVNWGSSWRMPTKEEVRELVDKRNCDWEWLGEGNTAYNGVAGIKITSKKAGFEGNSIFLPAAGYQYDNTFTNVGSSGVYWSSSIVSPGDKNVQSMGFNTNYWEHYSGYRCFGYNVRPVFAE